MKISPHLFTKRIEQIYTTKIDSTTKYKATTKFEGKIGLHCLDI